jgi:CRISPR-associated protein Csd2
MDKNKIFDKRVDLVLIASSTYSCWQGDPDRDNEPRMDPFSGIGFGTPQGIKRKIRDYLSLREQTMFIARQGTPLETILTEAKEKHGEKEKGVEYLCKTFWDLRAFGGVLTKPMEKNTPITGPVQVSFSQTVDPITVSNNSITRCVVTKEADARKEKTMGRLAVTPFGLYVTYVNINPFLAKRTGFTYGDYEMLLDACKNMFDTCKSTGRSQVHMERIIECTHESNLGNAASHRIHRGVKFLRNTDGLARSIEDYTISVDINFPGVTVNDMIV